MDLVLLSCTILIYSTLIYFYLIKKTGIRSRYVFSDNVIVILLSSLFSIAVSVYIFKGQIVSGYLAALLAVPGFAFTLTMARFWRIPSRKSQEHPDHILSPSDGKIIYIKKIKKDEEFISIKKGRISRLEELTKTSLLKTPCWLLGINMTPFDVHKNAAPISGRIILNQTREGKFLSLKSPESDTENERHTLVIQNEKLTIGVIQIASRLVRRIDNYVKVDQQINRGEWYGMIRFGSQVDIIIPIDYNIEVSLGTQVFAARTLIATPLDENNN